MSETLRRVLCLFGQKNLQKRSLMVCLIVGTILNAINQGPEVMRGEDVSLLKALLTYAVPYCVATYGAIAALLASAANEQYDFR